MTPSLPNPHPTRWTLLDVHEYDFSYVLVVRYFDATNFEGVKVMVYEGKFPGRSELVWLDPHFTPEGRSPVARFRPDVAGIEMAREFAAGLSVRSRKESKKG